MSETLVYRGWIYEGYYGENFDALSLEPDAGKPKYCGIHDEPLAQSVADDLDRFGPFVTVRYFISDREQTIEQAEHSLIQRLIGAADAEYQDAYSEVTGYLWTDEDLKVGGHDLIAELRTHVGQYAVLEITFSAEAVSLSGGGAK